MSRRLVSLVLLAAAGVAPAAVEPALPCDRPVFLFGAATVLGAGARATDFGDRMRVFFDRTCRSQVNFQVLAGEEMHLDARVAHIADTLSRNPRSIALVHYPFSDIEAGVPVDALLRDYRRIIDACAAGQSICIIGGQQPVNAFSQNATDQQLELERRAVQVLGAHYLPLYRHFQSESSVRRLMVPLDSGDGRFVDDRGHELLFELYRRRLLELTGSHRP